jgi:cupin 2 domain-containing protein
MKSSLFEHIPEALSEEWITVLEQNHAVRIERIVSDGQASPDGFWYDQEEDEWVLLVRGSAVLAFEDETVELRPGDYLLIPAHRKHRVESTVRHRKDHLAHRFF